VGLRQTRIDNLAIKMPVTMLSFQSEGEIFVVPCGKKERFAVTDRNDRLF